MICPHCLQEIEPIEETTSTISIVKDKNGQVGIWTEETRDIDNILLSKRVDEYKYFTNGDIDTINLKIYDGEDNLRDEKVIKHKEEPKVISIS